MRVIHFTEGATDFLKGFDAWRVRSVPLASGEGDVHITCLHLLSGSSVVGPPTTHDCALLVVLGRVIVHADMSGHTNLSGGMGVTLESGEGYSLRSAHGAIIIAVEAPHLKATAQGISSPERIRGQRWPLEDFHDTSGEH